MRLQWEDYALQPSLVLSRGEGDDGERVTEGDKSTEELYYFSTYDVYYECNTAKMLSELGYVDATRRISSNI